jgi:hypothetical protein
MVNSNVPLDGTILAAVSYKMKGTPILISAAYVHLDPSIKGSLVCTHRIAMFRLKEHGPIILMTG